MKTLNTLCLLLAIGTLMVAQGKEDETKCCCTTYDTSVCLSKIHESVDKDLNDTYKKALLVAQKFTDKDTQKLKDAEQKWISYRDADCEAEHGLWGKGSGGPNAASMCLIRLTKLRTTDLKNAYLYEH
jgi:uncharacterized protein YecT (DUF1311 family)